MNCDKCKEAIKNGEPVIYYGETLCPECYEEIKSSAGCCAPRSGAGSCCGRMEAPVEHDSCCSGHEHHHHGGCCAGPMGRGKK